MHFTITHLELAIIIVLLLMIVRSLSIIESYHSTVARWVEKQSDD